MVGVIRKELRDKTRTERLMKYFRDTRGWGEEAEVIVCRIQGDT